jgi:hypothetical protein
MRIFHLAIFALAVATFGCQSHLNFSKTIDLTPGEDYRFTVDPPKKDQTVVLSFNSSASPVSACIGLKTDERAIADSLVQGKPHAKELGRVENAQQGTLEAKIPAGQESVVFLWGATKNTSVKLHIKGK